ncbi:MAG: ThiF family adenylyltransferase [Pseudanabaena sp.]|jgi:PRTRC genetic system ThiF family protein
MSNLSLPFAEAVPILLPAYEELDLILIGCGGTGGWLAVNLPRIAYLQKQAGKKVAVTFIDPDRVEATNIPRQNFIPSDLGLPKASVLAARYGMQWGIEISAITSSFRADMAISRWKHLTICIGAVDNSEARAEIAKALDNSKTTFWLDCGNHYDSGQVLLGSRDTVESMKGAFHVPTFCTGLPSPALQHPDLLVKQESIQKVLSCEEAAISNAQSMSINHRIADEALDMLIRLLSGTLTRFATYVNCKYGTAWSRFNTPEEIAKTIGKPERFLN